MPPGALRGAGRALPVGELLEQFLLDVLEGGGERVRVVGGQEAGVHAEETLDGVAVLHGGTAVAVDQRARLLPRHARAVRDLLLGVLAAVRFEPGAPQQVQPPQEPGLQVGFARGAPREQRLHHGLRDARGRAEAAGVEDLGVRHAEAVGEGGDPGHDGRQRSRGRGARNLEAIRHRPNSHVSRAVWHGRCLGATLRKAGCRQGRLASCVPNHPESNGFFELASRSRHNCGEIRPSMTWECHDS